MGKGSTLVTSLHCADGAFSSLIKGWLHSLAFQTDTDREQERGGVLPRTKPPVVVKVSPGLPVMATSLLVYNVSWCGRAKWSSSPPRCVPAHEFVFGHCLVKNRLASLTTAATEPIASPPLAGRD